MAMQAAYVSDLYNNHVLVFKNSSLRELNAKACFVIGQSNFNTKITCFSNGFIAKPSPYGSAYFYIW